MSSETIALLVSITATLGATAAAVVFLTFWFRARGEAKRLRERYGAIDDVQTAVEGLEKQRAGLDGEVKDRRAALDRELQNQRDALARDIKGQRDALDKEIKTRRTGFETQFAAAMEQLKRLQEQVKAFDEQAELQSFGLYKPIFDLDTSEAYKQKLEAVRAQQAQMLKDKTAATCGTEWSVDGDKRKGKQMTDRNLKLQLRAFNGDCDAAIAKVRFNNVTAIEERLRKSFEAINTLGEANRCSLSAKYLGLKIDELRLTHELAEKIQAEKEEQRQIREQIREEELALKEMEKAQREAEKEEQRFEQALVKARAELESAGDRKQGALQEKIAELEAKLAAAHAQKAKATSMAQLTRAGHVYVISNEGSFGENVYKIGMTRRLDPMDRVKELGDASVPFGFDVHAVIYAKDAPALENNLHKRFAQKRLNLVNQRKEFFAVSLDEIEAAVRECHGHFEFTKLAIAEEYRKTLVMRATPSAHAPIGDSGDVLAGVLGQDAVRFEELRQAMAEA